MKIQIVKITKNAVIKFQKKHESVQQFNATAEKWNKFNCYNGQGALQAYKRCQFEYRWTCWLDCWSCRDLTGREDILAEGSWSA